MFEYYRRILGIRENEAYLRITELEPRPDVTPSVRELPERPAPGRGSPLQLGAPRVESDAVNLELHHEQAAQPPDGATEPRRARGQAVEEGVAG
jgi:hypothetical protein